MTQTDNEKDLINREIDGCNSETESARLREMIAHDPAARDEMKGLAEVSGALGGLPLLEAPPELKRLIMEAVREKRRHAARPAAPVAHVAERRGRRTAVRYVYAFAAGIAAGLIGGPLLMEFVGPVGPASVPGVVGTIAPTGGSPAGEMFSLHAGGVAGTARLQRIPAGYSVTMDLSAPETTEISVSSRSRGTTIVGHKQAAGTARGLTITPTTARWTQSGQVRLVIDFAATEDDGELILEVASGGETFRLPMRPARS